MRRLREKLGLHSAYLETIRGEGYRFMVPARLI
jgi:DNA-binding response OmpR family regulator